jgi:hypothetical protein
MASHESNITSLNIEELFSDNTQYIIPRYQRNYAWGAVEIEQLIQDIWDQSQQHAEKNYYLGSLVVFERKQGDSPHKKFETIDGQQRHTTLSIILSVFKNKFTKELQNSTSVNLTFDSRLSSETTLSNLYQFGLQDGRFNDQEASMIDAYVIVKKYFFKLLGDEKENVEKVKSFWTYFTSKVVILRSPVPYDTDLNHYFEIMNNRGEQLEKHEVLKARLMEKVESEKQYAFGQIWDACADMDRYVQYGFSSDIRKLIFGKDLNNTTIIFDTSGGFEKIADIFKATNDKQKVEEHSNSILSIFNSAITREEAKKVDDEGDERFNSIINFPNFLLQTLKVLKKGGTSEDQLPLDDKRLLGVFEDAKIDECDSAKEFIIALLKARFLFDKYVIKRERDKDWSLKRMIHYVSSGVNYINTFAKDADDYKETEGVVTHTNHRIKMLLGMLHVSFPAMIYKNWLNGTLNYLFNHNPNPSSAEYLLQLETYNDRIFYGLFGKEQRLNFHEIIYTEKSVSESFEKGELTKATHIQNYIFNRLDYAIWKASVVGDDALAIDSKRKIASICNNFNFSLRSSVEHYYPRTPLDGQPELVSGLLSNGVDSFGNLCLISSSKNSKLSNLMPKAKKDHYPSSAKNIESLKQQLMMSYPEWNSEHAQDINDHEVNMTALLVKRHLQLSDV